MINVYGLKEYDEEKIGKILDKIFEEYNVREKILPGMNVVIKPDMTVTIKDKKFSSVDYNIIKSVAMKIKKLGANVCICDKTDGIYEIENVEEEYSKLGLSSLEENGINLNRDCSLKEVSLNYKEDKIPILVINKILSADYIINMPKLKTSTMFGLSFATVNMFSTIDFRSIKNIYSKYENKDDICKVALMISSLYKKQLIIADAVECMEKDGPVNGEKIKLNAIIASDNMYKLDYFVASKIFKKVSNIPIISNLIETKSINYFDSLDIKLDENFKSFTYFELPTNLKKLSSLEKLSRKNIWPEINESKCIKCKLCSVRCPKGVIDEKNHKVIMDKRYKCIRCMLCLDQCPNGAIYLKKMKVKFPKNINDA